MSILSFRHADDVHPVDVMQQLVADDEVIAFTAHGKLKIVFKHKGNHAGYITIAVENQEQIPGTADLATCMRGIQHFSVTAGSDACKVFVARLQSGDCREPVHIYH